MKNNNISIEDINSNGIKTQAKIDGITEVELLATSGTGDQKITVYQFGPVRVADTNGDPVWEESDPCGFADLMEEAGINL
jgi:hypothetical protein